MQTINDRITHSTYARQKRKLDSSLFYRTSHFNIIITHISIFIKFSMSSTATTFLFSMSNGKVSYVYAKE